VRGAAPLAIDYFVVIIRVLDVGWFHGIGFGYGEPGELPALVLIP
jgi:hypothetical protein